jgi:hypothetical protein
MTPKYINVGAKNKTKKRKKGKKMSKRNYHRLNYDPWAWKPVAPRKYIHRLLASWYVEANAPKNKISKNIEKILEYLLTQIG